MGLVLRLRCRDACGRPEIKIKEKNHDTNSAVKASHYTFAWGFERADLKGIKNQGRAIIGLPDHKTIH